LTQRSAEGDELELERSGGFAGLTLRALVPFAELSPPQRAAVEEALSRPSSSEQRPDRFQFQLRLGDQETVLEEEDLPAVLRPLLGRLQVSR
jgi:hypothetical protein